MRGVNGGDGRRSGESEAEGLGDRGHGGSRAHRHAMAGAGGDVVFEILPVFAGKITRSSFGPILPDVGSRSEGFAAPRGPHHRSARHEDDRDVDHDRAHEKGGNGFIASSHQDGTIDGMGAKGFLDFHREKIAIKHRGGLHEGFAETHDGHFNGVATGLPDAAFDFFGALTKVRVAREEIVPGVENRNDRLALVFLVVDAELFVTGTMAEGAKVIATEEAVGAKLIGSEATHGVVGDCRKERVREREEFLNGSPLLNWRRCKDGCD